MSFLLYDDADLYDTFDTYDGVATSSGLLPVALTEGQIRMPNGLVMGDGTVFPIEKMEGLDLPDVREGDTARLTAHGEFAGHDYYQGRLVRLSLGMDSSINPSQIGTLRRALRSAFAVVDAPVPMTFRSRGGEVEKLLYVMPKRCHWAEDVDIVLGLPAVVAELKATDPVIYSSSLFARNLISGGGYPIVVNAGSWPVSPVVTVTGPAAGPIVITRGTQTVQVNTALTGGQQLVIDFARRSIKINGVSSYGLKDPTTQWWEIPPAYNLLTPNQASVETDVAYWIPSGCTLARSSAYSSDGTYSMEMTATGNAGFSANTYTGTDGIPVVPGIYYSGIASFHYAATVRNTYVGLVFYNASGTQISASSGSLQPDSSIWNVVTVTALAPATAAYVSLVVYVQLASTAEKHYVDKMGVFMGSTPVWATGGAVDIAYGGGGASAVMEYRWGEM